MGMNGYAGVPDVEASCAICGAPPYPECPHEAERLELALTQAAKRWLDMQAVRYALLPYELLALCEADHAKAYCSE